MAQRDARVLKLAAQYFGILAVPARLRLLGALRRGKQSVADLVLLSGCRKNDVSKHLAVLAGQGFVIPAAGTGYYRVADRTVFTLCETAWAHIRKTDSGAIRGGKNVRRRQLPAVQTSRRCKDRVATADQRRTTGRRAAP